MIERFCIFSFDAGSKDFQTASFFEDGHGSINIFLDVFWEKLVRKGLGCFTRRLCVPRVKL